MFKKILIANRGEIALRVARTCRELGVPTVAVHSTRDRDSAVVRMADESLQIGPPEPARSYLNAVAILEAALRTGAEAIHPGYGFLSEDADFAEACEANGIVLIGPPASVMARLGPKISARTLMSRAGLPLLRGSVGPLDAGDAMDLASQIGYPVIAKASAGGGGRGLRVIRHSSGFREAYARTQAEAQAFFGDSSVYLEKYLERARHVEVQVLCDGHGSNVHLGTRDCSVQRRHQKLLEEAPASSLPAGLAAQMQDAAVRGAASVGYAGAGTFEFLVDPDGAYYFLEVNCRIQVEHPVTEMITGLDLVAEQVKIAAGQRLALDLDSIQTRGVAIECRINAENPDQGFAPAPGVVEEFVPAGGPFVRVDTHVWPGYAIPPDYDSLLAKLVVWAPDRGQAIERALRALGEFRVTGPRLHTTSGFLADVLNHPRFRAAEHDTALVGEMLGDGG